jgi:hypothetical protein
MNGNTEAVSARQIDPIYASPLASTWGTLIVQIGGYFSTGRELGRIQSVT